MCVLFVVYVTMMGLFQDMFFFEKASLLNNERCIVYQHKHTLLLCSVMIFSEKSTVTL